MQKLRSCPFLRMVCPFLFPSVSFHKLKETLETRAEENGESTRTANLDCGNRFSVIIFYYELPVHTKSSSEL